MPEHGVRPRTSLDSLRISSPQCGSELLRLPAEKYPELASRLLPLRRADHQELRSVPATSYAGRQAAPVSNRPLNKGFGACTASDGCERTLAASSAYPSGSTARFRPSARLVRFRRTTRLG